MIDTYHNDTTMTTVTTLLSRKRPFSDQACDSENCSKPREQGAPHVDSPKRLKTAKVPDDSVGSCSEVDFAHEPWGQDSLHATALLDVQDETSDRELSSNDVPAHPLGIKPLGNLYSHDGPNIKCRAGLLSRLPDELLLQLLEFLSAIELVTLETTCKAMYAFCRHEELWRALFVELSPPSFRWEASWRHTYLKQKSFDATRLSCNGLYSDALYRPFFCAHTSLARYARVIPLRNEIPRLVDMTHSEFTNGTWADKPFILTAPVKEWPAYQNWSTAALLQLHAATKFRAEAVDWPLDVYVEYMRNNKDESPLYLFDSHFDRKMSLNDQDADDTTGSPSSGTKPAYNTPTVFGPDLFDLLESHRPNNKWLILGPARSGSTFHKDPNGTSAWNAVIRGSKYWLMFPSTTATGKTLPPPPGVFLSADASEITSPLSIAEYLLSFHAAARATPGCQEGICNAGEVLHVPSGWFHLVLNLEESLAITQNFVPEAHLSRILRFLKDTPEQISGFASNIKNEDVYDMFVGRLQEGAPELLEKARSELGGQGNFKPSTWGDMTTTKDNEGFSFGFGGLHPEDDIP